MGSAPIVTLGGRGTHNFTGTRRSQAYPSKEHLPFVQSSFQLGLNHTNTRAFLGYHAWETPSHPTSLSRQDSPRSAFPRPPSPVLSGGSPERGSSGRALAGSRGWRGSLGARGHEHHPVGSGRSCRESAAAAGSGSSRIRSSGIPHEQHSRQDWGEPQFPGAASPVPSHPHSGRTPARHSQRPSQRRKKRCPIVESGMGPCLGEEFKGLLETPHSTQG